MIGVTSTRSPPISWAIWLYTLVEVTIDRRPSDAAASVPVEAHSYEASAQDQLKVANADLIIENGGGYDAFVESLISSSGSAAPVITAATFSHDWPGEGGDGAADGIAEQVADEVKRLLSRGQRSAATLPVGGELISLQTVGRRADLRGVLVIGGQPIAAVSVPGRGLRLRCTGVVGDRPAQ